MNRNKDFLYNTVTVFLLQLCTVIAGFIVPRIILTAYGSEINGLVISVTQFIAYFNLVELGLAGAVAYALYKPLADNDVSGINALLTAANRFYILSGYIFVTLVLGLALIYPVFVRTAYLPPFQVGMLVFVLGVSGALEFFTIAKYRVLLIADQMLYILSIITIVDIILCTVIIAIFAYNGADIVTVRLIALFSVFARSLILYIYIRFKYHYIDFHNDYWEMPNNEALNKRRHTLYLQILEAIQSGAPVLITTFFISLSMVSVYAIFNMIVGGILALTGVFAKVISASWGDVIVGQEQAVLQKAYQKFEFIYYALISWVFSCTAVMIMPFVRLYTAGIKDVNYDLPVIGFLFVLNGLLYSLKMPQGMLVLAAGLYRETRRQVAMQGLIVVVAGLIFVYFGGLAGILLGSVLSNIYMYIYLLFYIPREITKLEVWITLHRMLRVFACFGLIYWPFMNCTNFTDWFFHAGITALYGFFVVSSINYIFDREVFVDVVGTLNRLLAKLSAV